MNAMLIHKKLDNTINRQIQPLASVDNTILLPWKLNFASVANPLEIREIIF